MDCDTACNLIAARLNGEITHGDSTSLDAHLAECSTCRAADESARLQDAGLHRAFAPRRRAAAAIAEKVSVQLLSEFEPRRIRLPWLALIGSAAAGFLLAVMILKSAVQPSTTLSTGIARLALATGPVEVRAAGHTEWAPLEIGEIAGSGSRIRTGPRARCEVHLADGSEVRMNASTELEIAGTRNLELEGGQVWVRVASADSPMRIRAQDMSVIARYGQFDLVAQPDQAALIVFDG